MLKIQLKSIRGVVKFIAGLNVPSDCELSRNGKTVTVTPFFPYTDKSLQSQRIQEYLQFSEIVESYEYIDGEKAE